eukprot:jgi/Bigna1/128955/aug1.7_g3663
MAKRSKKGGGGSKQKPQHSQASSSKKKREKKGAGSKSKQESPQDGKRVTFVLEFPSMENMASCLARVSAFLEDPKHHGEVSKPSQVSQLVSSRYAGHNFSLESFKKALSAIGDLTKEEAKVKQAISAAVRRGGRGSEAYYIIAHVRKDEKTLQHEKWHATYHFDDEYRSRVSGVWGMVKKGSPAWAEQFEKHLSDKYASHVWVDEFQAIVLNREYECATKDVDSATDASIPYVSTARV